MDIELSTILGNRYTDFEFSDMADGYHHYNNHDFSQPLNDGGNRLELERISGNIYLRKME